jgi:hypothetical protein
VTLDRATVPTPDVFPDHPAFEKAITIDQYRAGIKHAIERGWIVLHESGTFIRFTQAGADLSA